MHAKRQRNHALAAYKHYFAGVTKIMASLFVYQYSASCISIVHQFSLTSTKPKTQQGVIIFVVVCGALYSRKHAEQLNRLPLGADVSDKGWK